jgi:enoyl-CoA hydratase
LTLTDYAYGFAHILVDRPSPGVALFTLNRPERMNATNAALHADLAALPRRLDEDGAARVGVITGAGRAFSVGGDYDDVTAQGYDEKVQMMWETISIVSGMVEARKPMISAINGPAAGAGLAMALLADISIVSETANLSDGHTRIGLAAGDHAALIWPLLCGMAKAKRYLLTADKITGREAERIGLVSECAPAETVLPRALELAALLAERPAPAVQLTKRALNGWLREAMPNFESSLGYEMATSLAPDLSASVARALAK